MQLLWPFSVLDFPKPFSNEHFGLVCPSSYTSFLSSLSSFCWKSREEASMDWRQIGKRAVVDDLYPSDSWMASLGFPRHFHAAWPQLKAWSSCWNQLIPSCFWLPLGSPIWDTDGNLTCSPTSTLLGLLPEHLSHLSFSFLVKRLVYHQLCLESYIYPTPCDTS